MKKLILKITFIFYFLNFVSYGQNAQHLDTIYHYAKNDTYARSLCVTQKRIFLGNADGSIYFLDKKSGSTLKVIHLLPVDEIRDLSLQKDHILAMHSGNEGITIQINFDGLTKKYQPENWKGLFLDAMDFIGKQGFLMADPTQGVFNLFTTEDGGLTWQKCKNLPSAHQGEAGFAASGTNVQMISNVHFVFVSGGKISRFFSTENKGKTWKSVMLPYRRGTSSSGAYSVCFSDKNSGVIVGGDYKNPDLFKNTTFYTKDAGKTWNNPTTPTKGYRSCVIYNNGVYYCCGRNGIDYSINGGVDWKFFAKGTFFKIQISDNKLFATSNHGLLYRFNLKE